MPKPNRQFDLNVDDLELIETALRKAKSQPDMDAREIHDLLGRLHNQNEFFRPSGTYVSG